MNLHRNIALFTLVLLTACQNGEDASTSAAQNSAPADITVRATADFMAPAPIIGGTVVPNSTASWLGHLILLDENGRLHRATADSRETETVALGKYRDVVGLARKKQAGIFFALGQGGNIKGFIETDDEGNFGPLAISYGDLDIERFCHVETPQADSVRALTSGGELIVLKADIFEDTSAALTQEKALGTDCSAFITRQGSSLAYNGKTVGITNGLSIAALDTPGFVMSTQANMGSVYNQGLILAADRESGRVVLISRSYFMKEVGIQE